MQLNYHPGRRPLRRRRLGQHRRLRVPALVALRVRGRGQGRPGRPRGAVPRHHRLPAARGRRQRLRGQEALRRGGAAPDGRDVAGVGEGAREDLRPGRGRRQLLVVERPLAGGARSHGAGDDRRWSDVAPDLRGGAGLVHRRLVGLRLLHQQSGRDDGAGTVLPGAIASWFPGFSNAVVCTSFLWMRNMKNTPLWPFYLGFSSKQIYVFSLRL